MAKNNMLLGYARGKVGDLVFQRRKGEQIVKARNRNPANPRTWAQQMQRVRMYAPVQFYKTAIENFYRFAFEDKKSNETDYNAFIRENLNAFQGPYFTREQVQQKYPVIAPYVISSGTLGNTSNKLFLTTSDVKVGVETDLTEISEGQNNVGFISQQLINKYGLQEGDMITFIATVVSGITIGDNNNVVYNGNTSFRYINFVIDTTSNTRITPNLVEGANEGITVNKTTGESIPKVTLFGTFKESEPSTKIIAYAVITTRRSNGKILASRTNIQLNEAAMTYYEAMSTSQQLLRAAASYDATISALDPNSAKVMTESSSQANVVEGRSTEQTAFNCLPSSGSKTTDGNPAYTLDNECPSCDCPTPTPDPCGDETVTTTTTTTTRKRTTRTVEEE